MKALFFGVSGNSGLYCLNDLLSKGWTITGISRTPPKISHPNFKFIAGDITDKSLFNKLPSSVDVVINFAGVQPSILNFSENTNLDETLRTYVDINIVGVFNILEFVRKKKIRNYIYTTSHREYENYWKDGFFIPNDLPPAINYKGDHVMYAISKTSAKMVGDYFSQAFDIRVFNMRLPMMFMVPSIPYYLKNGKQEIMPFLKIIKSALDGNPLEIWGNPNLQRDYVHIQNLSNMMSLCLESKLNRGTFNVGTGEAVTTDRFIRSIGTMFFPDHSMNEYIYKPSNVTYKCAIYDINEQKELLGYKPILLDEMLKRLKEEIKGKNKEYNWGWKV
jgi:UDP-glucose 4-epimerase